LLSTTRFSLQRRLLDRLFQKIGQNLDDQFMVGALRQAGNRYVLAGGRFAAGVVASCATG
jgi:hypothetical protein